jgi:hypothetical protein
LAAFIHRSVRLRDAVEVRLEVEVTSSEREATVVLLRSVKTVLTARSRLPSPGGTGEDAPVEMLEIRTRPKASRHRLTSDATIAVLLEYPRS